jgi:catechol 2,3-dioxygenase-like lactoylglutathione lyase family enzyme
VSQKPKSATQLPPSVAFFLPHARPRISKRRRTGVNLNNLDQISIVVRDMDRAIEYWSSVFGLGPFYVVDDYPAEMNYRGHLGKCRLKMGFALVNGIEIELIQVLEGDTPHLEHLAQHGEGLFHLRFRVDDLDGTLAKLAEEDVSPIWCDRYPGGVMAYLDSYKVGGVRFELVRSAKSLSESERGK